MKFDRFINKEFTAKEIQDIQCSGKIKPSCDIIFGMNNSDVFTIEEVKLSEIKGPKNLTLNFYRRKGLDEDISIVNRIVKALQEDDEILPIVCDNDLSIMDGLHRYVAYKEFYKRNDLIKVFKKKNI